MQLMKKPELLIPAGNFEKLKVAIHYGADAVYLAGPEYGLRKKAGNFPLQELEEAVKYAHEKETKVYVTVNIYPRNSDLNGITVYLKEIENLALLTDEKLTQEELEQEDHILAECLVTDSSELIGQTLQEANFRRSFGSFVLAIRREGEVIRRKLAHFILKPFDTLLVYGPKDRINQLASKDGFIVLGKTDADLDNHPLWWLSPITILCAVGLAIFEIVPIVVGVILGVIALLLARIITPNEAYSSIHWQVIIVIAAFLPMGAAIQRTGLDIMIVRELTGGIYFGEPRGIKPIDNGERKGINTHTYTTSEIIRVARIAFDLAKKRSNKVTSCEKSNVMEAGQLWKEEVQELHDKEYKDVELSHMLADNCAMQLLRNPKQFDVIVTDNLFGDMLSDQASMLTGSLGLLPSASLGAKNKDGEMRAMYEPIHGSAPDIAGKGIANPIASILSFAMALRYSLDLDNEADALEKAVQEVLNDGLRTKDIISEGTKDTSTSAMGDAIISKLQ